MASALVPGASGPGSSPDRGHWGNCGGMTCDGLASRLEGVEGVEA